MSQAAQKHHCLFGIFVSDLQEHYTHPKLHKDAQPVTEHWLANLSQDDKDNIYTQFAREPVRKQVRLREAKYCLVLAIHELVPGSGWKPVASAEFEKSHGVPNRFDPRTDKHVPTMPGVQPITLESLEGQIQAAMADTFAKRRAFKNIVDPRQQASHLQIWQLGVHPDYRKYGLGSALVNIITELALFNHCCMIGLETTMAEGLDVFYQSKYIRAKFGHVARPDILTSNHCYAFVTTLLFIEATISTGHSPTPLHLGSFHQSLGDKGRYLEPCAGPSEALTTAMSAPCSLHLTDLLGRQQVEAILSSLPSTHLSTTYGIKNDNSAPVLHLAIQPSMLALKQQRGNQLGQYCAAFLQACFVLVEPEGIEILQVLFEAAPEILHLLERSATGSGIRARHVEHKGSQQLLVSLNETTDEASPERVLIPRAV